MGAREHTTSQEVVRRLENGRGIFYIAVDTATSEIVGIKFGYIEGNTCIGRGIAVLREYRHQEIGTQLLRQFEAELQSTSDVNNYVFGSASDVFMTYPLQPDGLAGMTGMVIYPTAFVDGWQNRVVNTAAR